MFSSEKFTPYRLVGLAVLVELGFVIIPLVIGFWYSVNRVQFFQIRGFTGLENYWRVLNSPSVANALTVTIAFSVISLFLTFVIGFGLAMWLERSNRLNGVMQAVVLIPYMIAMLVGSMLLKWVFSKESGLSDLALAPMGMGDVSILANPDSAMAALVYNAVWRDSAFAMIMLLAGLKSIPAHLQMAARVDGASAWYRFRRITLPLLQVPIFITVVRLFIHLVNTLTYPLILTGGGPGTSTETVVLKMYRLGFNDNVLGQANALAIMVFIVNIALVALLLRLFKKAGKIQ
ncbi:carbohydrate ABC transporter permease [Microvirga pudoricolor]|uniref:carbohydrate ABC transporter permease n=1 Tax=Microvirga pudoricolor TaxID=2778729 RepID=UPI00194FF4EC|nr:sugar ABC transporter permease [Microvirga pudoricolor]MBM6595324.1 sugar ABC transporter permease [Microvirga pudoricolor]